MSLDNIQLPPLIIQHLFQKTLIINPANKNNSVIDPDVLSFLGRNNLNIAILVKNSGVDYLNELQSVFLIDILNACKLNMNDVALVNLHQNKEVTHQKIFRELEAKIVLLFGVSTEEINLPFTIPEFQVQSFNKQKYMSAPALDILQNEIELKKKLWTSLKQIFL